MERFHEQPHAPGETSKETKGLDDTAMKKERRIKDDGRYIIFFSFEEDEGANEGGESS